VPYMTNGKRDYKKEHRLYGSKPKVKARRARNNKARRKLIKAGKASVGDGKDVSHIDSNTRNQKMSNLKNGSRSKNRSVPRTKRGHRRR